ncbi:MAG: IS110 family transposase, partial [Gemmatimonadales bacterium]
MYLGIDVAKDTVVLASEPAGRSGTFPTDAAGLSALVRTCQAGPVTLLVLEATGGYEAPVVAALAAAGLPLVVVNPRQVRDFAKATGQLAKTDLLDADILAVFAERVRPAVRPLPDAEAHELDALLTRRR